MITKNMITNQTIEEIMEEMAIYASMITAEVKHCEELRDELKACLPIMKDLSVQITEWITNLEN